MIGFHASRASSRTGTPGYSDKQGGGGAGAEVGGGDSSQERAEYF